MPPQLSVVISCKNEQMDLLRTIASIRATAPSDKLEIIVVDDMSPFKLRGDGDTRVIHNRHWAGVGPSRHIGVIAANAPYILITDSHMVFCPGWFEATIAALEASPDTLFCGQCLGLSEKNSDPAHPEAVYSGAKMVLEDTTTSQTRYRILKSVWKTHSDGDEMTGIMGALYACSKRNFLSIGGLRMLKGFGLDEEFLSIKWIRAGWKIRYLSSLKAGHKFRTVLKPPYRIELNRLYYNIAMVAWTCCPEAVAMRLLGLLRVDHDIRLANEQIASNWGLIATERDLLSSLFTMGWEDYAALLQREK